MLKRHQVLLESWQTEYIKDISERYGQSFSEVIRVLLSESFLRMISLLEPDYKSGITDKELLRMVKRVASPDTTTAEKHSLVSTLNFESRKAVEYRQNTVKRHKKSQPLKNP